MGFYPDVIETALNEMQILRMKVFDLIEAARVAEKIGDEFKETIRNFRLSYGVDMIRLQGILVQIDVNDMKEVIPILKYLAKNGYPKKGEPEDYPEIRRRTWDCGQIKVSAFLPWGEKSKCKYVKVGVVENPVYELQCEEVTPR